MGLYDTIFWLRWPPPWWVWALAILVIAVAVGIFFAGGQPQAR